MQFTWTCCIECLRSAQKYLYLHRNFMPKMQLSGRMLTVLQDDVAEAEGVVHSASRPAKSATAAKKPSAKKGSKASGGAVGNALMTKIEAV